MYFFFQNGRIQDVSLQCLGNNTVVVTGKFFSLTTNDFLDVKIYIDLNLHNCQMLKNDSSLSNNDGKTYQLQMDFNLPTPDAGLNYLCDFLWTINCPQYLDFWCALRKSTENIFDRNKETPITLVYA